MFKDVKVIQSHVALFLWMTMPTVITRRMLSSIRTLQILNKVVNIELSALIAIYMCVCAFVAKNQYVKLRDQVDFTKRSGNRL